MTRSSCHRMSTCRTERESASKKSDPKLRSSSVSPNSPGWETTCRLIFPSIMTINFTAHRNGGSEHGLRGHILLPRVSKPRGLAPSARAPVVRRIPRQDRHHSLGAHGGGEWMRRIAQKDACCRFHPASSDDAWHECLGSG